MEHRLKQRNQSKGTRGQGQTNKAVLLRRVQSGMNDCFLRYLFEDGSVHSLFLRNGMGSSRRMGDGLAVGGISEIRWQPGRDAGEGKLLQVEQFTPAPWQGNPLAYAACSVLLELAEQEMRPGSKDPLIADFLMRLFGGNESPGIHSIYFMLACMRYLDNELQQRCQSCDCFLFAPGHPVAIMSDPWRAVCAHSNPSQELPSLERYYASVTGRQSRFLSLLSVAPGPFRFSG